LKLRHPLHIVISMKNRKPEHKEYLLMESHDISPKSRLVALLLCFFLGWLGIHRFYVGKIGTGILMLLTAGGFGIWVIIDLILIVMGSFTDKEGRRVFMWLEPGSI